jgi:hypothetical protein
MTDMLRNQVTLTTAEAFWYVLGCIALGATYFAKIPTKKALSEVGLGPLTNAEKFWYVLMCIPFGGAYFAKVPVKKALSEFLDGTGRPMDAPPERPSLDPPGSDDAAPPP